MTSWWLCWCTPQIFWELFSNFIKVFSFVSINQYAVGHMSEKFCSSLNFVSRRIFVCTIIFKINVENKAISPL